MAPNEKLETKQTFGRFKPKSIVGKAPKQGVEGCLACEEKRLLREQELLLEKQKRQLLLQEQELARNPPPRKMNLQALHQKTDDKMERVSMFESGFRKHKESKKRATGKRWQTGEARVFCIERRWSGFTTQEEVERRMYDQDYSAKLEESERSRKLYKETQKEQIEKIVKQRAVNAGPEWFQDLSDKQMKLADTMSELIKADLQEGIVSRTERALTDIGVFPALPQNKVWKCMNKCLSNMIQFFFLVHRAIVEEEQEEFEAMFNQARRENRYLSPFSINERLILSCVFRIHFDTLTRKLDRMLPPPYRPSKVLIGARPKKPPKPNYDSPYLEPLPINDKVWFEQRAEDELYEKWERKQEAKRKRSMERQVELQMEMLTSAKEEKIRNFLQQKAYEFEETEKKKREEERRRRNMLDEDDPVAMLLDRENKSVYFKRKTKSNISRSSVNSQHRRKSKKSSSAVSDANVSKSQEHVRKNKRFMYDVVHEGMQTRTSFGGFFAGDNKLIKDSEGAQMKSRLVPRDQQVQCLYRDDTFSPLAVLSTRIWIRCRDVGVQTCQEPMFLPLVSLEDEHVSLLKTVNATSSTGTNTDQSVDANHAEGPPEDCFMKNKDPSGIQNFTCRKQSSSSQIQENEACREEERFSDKCPLSKKTPAVECVDETCEMVTADETPMDEFDFMKKRIAGLPPEKQLQAALTYLKEKGDPLAILPHLEYTPWLMRWFEKRRGVKLTLSQQDKDLLMEKSLRQWEAPFTSVGSVTMPSIKLPFRIPFSKKKELLDKVSKHVFLVHRKQRQQMVNNARDLFPSLYIEYFNTPLNKSLRKTFFTYLPSRELDTYVFRPWLKEGKEDPMIQED